MNGFRDILEPRRSELSNFMWVSRELKTTVPYKQTVKIGPQQLKLEVLRSATIQQLIAKLHEEQGLSQGELEVKVKEILDEIGYNRKLKVIRWLGLALAKIFTRVCNGIHVREENVLHLKSEMGRAPIIYLPSHRSYADFILMSYICFHYDIEIPAIAAGMDFHGMLGMGSVLRDTGAFFMRRSYNDDSLYWQTFREYVHQLVVKGDLGIEFFIEGTRSRTGKSLPPKFGLVTMVLKAFLNGEVPDVLFVPINISYDRVMEERLFAFELLGVPKPKESTSAFFKSLKLINDNYGDIYVTFGEAIPARRFFDDRIKRTPCQRLPKHLQIIAEPERRVISTLAEEIVNRQQKLCVIITFNLAALAFMVNFGPAGLKLITLLNEMTWLRSVLETLGATTNFRNSKEEVIRSLWVHRNLLRATLMGDVVLVQEEIVLGNLDASQLKGHCLSERTMNMAVPFVMLQLYVNPTLHYFINPALVTVIIKRQIENDKLFEEFSFLRSLFSREFGLFPNRERSDYDDAIKNLQTLKMIEIRDSKMELLENEKLQTLFIKLLMPFVFTYFTVCHILETLAVIEYSERTVLKLSQDHIEKLLLSTRNANSIHPYSLNLDSITNAFLSLVHLKVVENIQRKEGTSYRTNREEVHKIKVQLGEYLRLVIAEEATTGEILNSAVHLPSKM